MCAGGEERIAAARASDAGPRVLTARAWRVGGAAGARLVQGITVAHPTGMARIRHVMGVCPQVSGCVCSSLEAALACSRGGRGGGGRRRLDAGTTQKAVA